MLYPTPQFIEIEDKIIGPFTLRQFIFIAAGATIVFILFFLMNTFIWILISIPIAAFCLALAFLKINGRAFGNIFLLAIKHFWQPRLYIWKKIKTPTPQATKPITTKTLDAKKAKGALTSSRLKELAWKLDIKQKI